MLPWRRRPRTDADERLEAWERLQESRHRREMARRLKDQFQRDYLDRLEEAFVRALGGKR